MIRLSSDDFMITFTFYDNFLVSTQKMFWKNICLLCYKEMLVWRKAFYKWAKARDKYKRAIFSSSVIVYEGVRKEDDILKVDLRKKMLSDVEQSWGFAKAVEVENK